MSGPSPLLNFSKLYENLANDNFLDCKLMTKEGKSIYAHRAILSARSPVLKTAFEGSTNQFQTMVFTETKLDILKAMVEFIYTGKVKIKPGELDAFTKAARFFKVSIDNALNQLKIDKKNVAISVEPKHADTKVIMKPKRGKTIGVMQTKRKLTIMEDTKIVVKKHQETVAKQLKKKVGSVECPICQTQMPNEEMLNGHIDKVHRNKRRCTIVMKR